MKTLLVNGSVPANTECPYKFECADFARNFCIHLGKNHPVPFSCAMARSFEITVKPKKKKK